MAIKAASSFVIITPHTKITPYFKAMILYHGSPTQGIEKLTMEPKHRRHDMPHEGEGIYLTDNLDTAKRYGLGGSIYTVKLLSSPVFDATDPEEFKRCLRMAKEEAGEVRLTKESAQMIRQMIKSIVAGRWGVTNFGDQVRQVLLNDEIAVSDPDNEEKISRTVEVINAYIEEHPVVKYYDQAIGEGKPLIYVVRDPSLLVVQEEKRSDDE